jgi:hypothetical protein
MLRLSLGAIAALGLAGCAMTPSPPPGYLPADAFGNAVQGQDPTVAATEDARIAFAYPGRMQGKPAQMALAIASVEALASQFDASGRFAANDATSQLELARSRLRQILGISQAALPQAVIDPLVAASRALREGDRQAALVALGGPVFLRPPRQTLGLLSHFPSVPAANLAMVEASNAEFPQDGGDQNGF